MAASNNHVDNNTRRLDVAVQLFEAYSALSCCCILLVNKFKTNTQVSPLCLQFLFGTFEINISLSFHQTHRCSEVDISGSLEIRTNPFSV